MIRFILKNTRFDGNEFKHQCHFTIDCDVPELEKILSRGGYGDGPNNDGFDVTDLVAAEVLPDAEHPKGVQP